MHASVRSPLSEMDTNRPGQSGVASLSEELQIKFNRLVTKAKDLTAQGMVKHAIEYNKRALSIYKSEKLVRRIQKMEAYLAQKEASSEEDGDGMVHVGNGFYLYKDLCNKLYAHQRQGILWMWKIHKSKGGILGDDMGLGKTIQVIAFLSGMFDADHCKNVLIVLPVAVIMNWEREFEKWAPGIRVVAFHGTSKHERERSLLKIQQKGGVVLTSYGLVITNAVQLSKHRGREFVWDYIILDEGHKIKNPTTKCSKSIHNIPGKHRLILSGTPIQNNLKEMWALFDWTHQGTLLGTARTFSMEYEQPITRSRQKDATSNEQRLGAQIASSLKKIIDPFFLRRTKAEVTKQTLTKSANNDGNPGYVPVMPTFTRKNDLICWLYLSDVQQKIYQAFVQTEEVRDLLNSTRSPLTALVILKKICDHPRLMTNRQCASMGITKVNLEDMDENTASECAANRIRDIPNELLISESGKIVVLVQLLNNLRSEGHRALVFSQSRKILDIIQKVLTAQGHKVMRLDGTIRLLAEREKIIKKFTRDKSYSVFLLTTQVGGVGLTLTAADRVVIFDPSWNPATDAQAVDRAFRIGQEKDVVIYRLITCGSIEEKIYRRQIFKDSITKQTTGDSKNPFRYFSRQELHELFVLDDPRYSSTQVQLQEIHHNQRRTDTSLDAHIAFLMSLDIFGISDHDLMFSQEADDDDDDMEAGQEYITSRVTKAQQAISEECDANRQLTEQLGKYPAPEVNQPRTKRVFGNEEVPQRPNAPTYLLDLEALHHKSLEGELLDDDDDDDDVNQSMSQLHVTDSPPVHHVNKPSPWLRSPPAQQDSDHDTTGSCPDFSPDVSDAEDKGRVVVADESPQKAEQVNPLIADKKTLKKRRASVCAPTTPHRKFSAEELEDCTNNLNIAEDHIVTEELIFSPKAHEPLITASPSKQRDVNKSPSSFNENEYQSFARAIQLNSTVLPEPRKLPEFLEEDKIEEEEFQDQDKEVEGDVSQIQTDRIVRSRKAVLHSSDEDMPEVDTSDQPEHDTSGQPEHDTNDQLKHNTSDQPEHDTSDQPEHDTSDQPKHETSDVDDEDDNGEENPDRDNPHESMQAEITEDNETESEEEELTEEEEQRYIDLMTQSRSFYKAHDYIKALEYALDALEIYSGDDRALRYVQKLKAKILK